MKSKCSSNLALLLPPMFGLSRGCPGDVHQGLLVSTIVCSQSELHWDAPFVPSALARGLQARGGADWRPSSGLVDMQLNAP
eukprot:2916158-Amphidinium_carterae.1